MFVNSNSGIDTNNGSIKKPFRTLAKAYDSMIDKLDNNLIILINSAEEKKMETKKLYRVTLRGMTYNSGGNVVHGTSYVVSTNSEEAYKKVREYLDKKDIGFSGDRSLRNIELLAEDYEFTDTGCRLFI